MDLIDLNSFTKLDISENVSYQTVYFTLFVSLVANGLTNIPSSQIVYLTFGYILTKNALISPLIGILVGSIGNTLGNTILYKIIKRHSDFLNTKVAKFLNIDLVKLDYYMKQVKMRGSWWLVFGKCIPSLKVLVPIIVGLSEIETKKAVSIFFLGSLLWATIVTYLGYHFGKTANLLQFYLVVTCIYIVIGLITSYKIKKNSKDNKQ